MLEILGQAQDPAVIQAHLKKLFAGITRVQFDESATHITAMCSAAGEVLPSPHTTLGRPTAQPHTPHPTQYTRISRQCFPSEQHLDR